jgi:replicative DNA helicase
LWGLGFSKGLFVMTADNADTHAAVPPPTLAPAVPGGHPVPELLGDVDPGGLLDIVLERAKQAAVGPAGSEIRGRLHATLGHLRDAAKEARSGRELREDYQTTTNVPAYVINAAAKKYNSDHVLIYSLSCHWCVKDWDDRRRSRAWDEYQKHPEEYDQLLGDFLPADFREEAWAHISQQRFGSGTNPTALQDWPVYSRRLEKRREKELLGVSTGLPKVDSSLHGLRGLTYLGSGPGVGKTCLALFMAVNALRRHPRLGVLFYTLDMAKTVVLDRLFCQVAGVDYADLVGGTDDHQIQERLKAAETELNSDILPRLRLVERLEVKQTYTLCDMIIQDWNLLISAGCWPVLVIADYFQLLPVATKGASAIDADFERVRTLQQAQENSRSDNAPDGFPIVAITEVRKGDSGRTEISIGGLMGSARLGYSADNVLVLEAVDPSSSAKEVGVRLHILKSRDGTVRGSIDLVFEHTKSRFREVTARPARKTGAKSQGEAQADEADQPAVDPFAGLENS